MFAQYAQSKIQQEPGSCGSENWMRDKMSSTRSQDHGPYQQYSEVWKQKQGNQT